MFFGRASEFPVPFTFPSSRKLHLQVSFPKPSQTKAWGQGGQLKSVCLLAMLQNQTWAYYSWVSIYILLSTFCTLCFKESAFFSASLQPCRSYLFPPHLAFCFYCLRLSICIFFYVCVESLLEFAGGSSQRDGLFSALNENWQLEYAIHNLIYPPNWKAREEWNAGEGSAVCFADLGQLSYLKCFLCVVCGVQDGRFVQLTRLCWGSWVNM